MAGHSKWANIQHRKGRQDAARSKLFSKLAKEITVAAKMGDPDPDKNPRLRLAVNNAKANSVPKDVIDRAIKKSLGGDAQHVRVEGLTDSISISTLEGEMHAVPDDWVIRGTRGEFYPCKPGPFADTFEEVDVPL